MQEYPALTSAVHFTTELFMALKYTNAGNKRPNL